MAYVETWNESTPDGATQAGSVVDDNIRELKRAVRERLEGDVALNGLVTDFAGTAKPKAGMARVFNDLDANKGVPPLEDGRLFISTDLHRLYSQLAAGQAEIEYLNRSGVRAMTGDLDMGGFSILNATGGFVAPKAKIVKADANQSIPNGGAFTKVSFSAQVYSEGTITVDLANNKITITQDGVYLIIGSVEWAGNVSGLRKLQLEVDAASKALSIKPGSSDESAEDFQQVMDLVQVTAQPADVFLEVRQDSGGALDVRLDAAHTFLAVVRIF